jgi:hypothetical protein
MGDEGLGLDGPRAGRLQRRCPCPG